MRTVNKKVGKQVIKQFRLIALVNCNYYYVLMIKTKDTNFQRLKFNINGYIYIYIELN